MKTEQCEQGLCDPSDVMETCTNSPIIAMVQIAEVTNFDLDDCDDYK